MIKDGASIMTKFSLCIFSTGSCNCFEMGDDMEDTDEIVVESRVFTPTVCSFCLKSWAEVDVFDGTSLCEAF